MRDHGVMPGFGLELIQAELNDDIERIREWADANPDRFGGLWFDNDAALAGTGPVMLTIAVVGDAEPVQRQLKDSVTHPGQIQVVTCRWTHAELSDLRDQIWREQAGQPFEGTYITTAGPDERANVVHVGISTDDEAFAQQLLDRYGAERIQVELNVRPIHFNP